MVFTPEFGKRITQEQLEARQRDFLKSAEQIDPADISQRPKKTDRSFFEKFRRFGGAVFGGELIGEAIGAGLTEQFVQPGLRREGEELRESQLERFPERREEIEAQQFGPQPTQFPDTGQLAGDIAVTGLGILPFTKGFTTGRLGKQALKAGALGAGLGAAASQKETGEISPLRTGISGAVGAALPLAGKGLEIAGEEILRLPERLIRTTLGQSKQAILKELKSKGEKGVAKFFLDKGKVGTTNSIIEGSEKAIDTLDNQISAKLVKEGSDVLITRDDFFSNLATTSPQFSEALATSDDLIEVIVSNVPRAKALLREEGLSPQVANEIRKRIDKKLGGKAFIIEKGSDAVQDLREIANSLRGFVKDNVDDVAPLFDEFSGEIRVRNLLLDKLAAGERSAKLGLLDLFALAGGGLIGSGGGGESTLLGGALGVLGRRGLSSTPFGTGVAQTVGRLAPPIGRGIQSVAPAVRPTLTRLLGTTGNTQQ